MSEPHQSQSPYLDYEQLQMLVEAGASESADLLNEILALFEEESGQKIRELKAYRDSANWESFSRSAHALAGSSANIGCREVWKKAKHLENLCKSGEEQQAGTLIPDLEETYSRTMEDLREYASSL